MSLIAFTSIVLFTIVKSTFACSPEGYVHRNLVERMNDAQAALFGQITRTFPDPNWSSAYTAEMMVKCVLKSPDTMVEVPMMVNISEAGSIPGMCHSTDLQVGEEYLVTLRVNDDRVIPDEYQYDASRVAEAALTCGITPRPPTGGSMDNCPAPAEKGQCNESETPSPREPPPPPPGKDVGVVSSEESEPTMEPGKADKPDAVVGNKDNEASTVTSVTMLSVCLPVLAMLLSH